MLGFSLILDFNSGRASYSESDLARSGELTKNFDPPL
jgi:hypothetical protein